MTYPFWEPNKAYNPGDIVNSDPISGNGAYAFQAVYTASSGSTQPAFSLIYGKTTQDDTQVWTTISPAYEVLRELEPSALIELFHIRFTNFAANSAEVLSGSERINVNGRPTDTWTEENLYFHAGTNGIPTSIVFAGQSYTAAPVEAEGFDKTIKGVLPRPTLRVANAQNTISSLMHRSNNPIDPLMAEVTRIQTFKKFIDAVNFFDETYVYQDGNTAVTQGDGTPGSEDTLVLAAHGTGDSTSRLPDQVYRIDRIASENQGFVEFELSSRLDLTNVLLPRRLVADYCPWKYRGVECGYNGGPVATVEDITTGVTSATDQCGKRLKSCKLRFPNASQFDPLPFGGFPAAGISA